MYKSVGAEIMTSTEELMRKSNIIVKVNPPTELEVLAPPAAFLWLFGLVSIPTCVAQESFLGLHRRRRRQVLRDAGLCQNIRQAIV